MMTLGVKDLDQRVGQNGPPRTNLSHGGATYSV
jgi:hypothetical protein